MLIIFDKLFKKPEKSVLFLALLINQHLVVFVIFILASNSSINMTYVNKKLCELLNFCEQVDC